MIVIYILFKNKAGDSPSILDTELYDGKFSVLWLTAAVKKEKWKMLIA